MKMFLAISAVLWSLGTALALTPDELLKDPALEARARALSGELRCLVCQNQSIDDSDAPLAQDLRVLIREHLVKGESDAAIMDFVVARYGEFVLLTPRFSVGNLVLWAGPFVIVLFGAGLLLARLRTRPVDAELTSAEAERLRRLADDETP